MADYLPPVVTKLTGDVGDILAKVEEVKAAIKSIGGDKTIKIKVDDPTLAAAAKAVNDLANKTKKLDDATKKVPPDLDSLRRSTISADEAFIKGGAALDDYGNKLLALKRDLIAAGAESRYLGTELGRVAREQKMLADGSGPSGLSKILNMKIPGLSGIPGVGSVLAKIPLPAIIGILAAAVSLVGGLSAEIGAIIAGFTAATAGLGAFALFAIPTITRIYNALAKGSGKGLHGQLLQVYSSIQGVIAEYQKLAAAFGKQITPVALKLINDFAKEAKVLLPELIPLANAAFTAIAGLFGGLDKAIGGILKSPGSRLVATGPGHRLKEILDPSAMQNAISVLSKYAGPAITAIGKGLAKVIVTLGQFVAAWFKVLSVKDVVNGINIFFGILAGTIKVVGGLLLWLAKSSMFTWDSITTGVKNVINWLHNINKAIDTFVNASIKFFSQWGKDIAAEWSKAAATTSRIWGQIERAVSNAGSWIVGSIIKTGHSIESNWNHAWSAVVNYVKGVPGAIVRAFGSVGSLLSGVGHALIDGLIGGIKSAIPGLSSVLGWVKSLIPSWKGPIEQDRQLLVPHGQAIMNGLMAGMTSRIPALRSLLQGVTSLISHGGSGAPWTHGSVPMIHAAKPLNPNSGQWFGGPMVVESHVYIDSREVYTAVQKRAVRRQKRSGNNGLQRMIR
jgi:hypothetical protein